MIAKQQEWTCGSLGGWTESRPGQREEHMSTNTSDTSVMQGEDDPKAKMAGEETELVATKARFEAIRAWIADPEYQPAEFSRLVVSAIAMVTKDILLRGFTAEDDYIARAFTMPISLTPSSAVRWFHVSFSSGVSVALAAGCCHVQLTSASSCCFLVRT